ncbi:spore coat protein [Amphibacillus sp. MSJ-3]|uniref:spore coat protein n=1 Tax=Amphibacillus sp. MSJ-3 TaxID=2841505 RepID=UPI001C0ECCF1|nr:spore coat protein [Amphibacillus sp. MSJ-3]MBU5594033.1 spore coat protein [Amphibacillus sp. MSJ-3]
MQQVNQQSNGTMPQPPMMISTKDLLYLTDMMSWNLNVIKKAHDLANHCQLPEIKQAIEQVGKMHQKHYQQLLNFTKSQSNQANQ